MDGGETNPRNRHDLLAGVILGTAVGDALGLPREGLSARRAKALFGASPLRHCFLFGHGLTSDDTEHTCLLAQALLRHPDNPDRFVRSLAWGLRWWFLGMPAGIGKATLQACLKLWIGFSPRKSGVWSAGNGPAMRSALLGVCLSEDLEMMRRYVSASTRLTHTDPRAERGALLVALAARHGALFGPEVDAKAFLDESRALLHDVDTELKDWLNTLESHLVRRATPAELAAALGMRRGVSGFVYHTVPIALYCWLCWPNNFRRAVEEAILLGGDADTIGAITGAIAGATVGSGSIPTEWRRLWEWPRSITWMKSLAEQLSRTFPVTESGARPGALPLCWPALPARNLVFLVVVLMHAFRRLLPPYSSSE